MGQIVGDVNVIGIANLLQLLGNYAKEGVLTINQGPDQKSVYFGPQGVKLAATSVRKLHSLGEILLRSGKLSSNQLLPLLEAQKKTGRRLGEIVVNLGVLSKDDIDSALREQVEEEIFDLFTWQNAAFRFEEQNNVKIETKNPLSDVALDSNLLSLMLEAARRADELRLIREIIPNDDVIPIRVTEQPPADHPNVDHGVVTSLFPILDGSITVGEISNASLYPRFTILRSLFVLANEGAIKIHHRGKTMRRDVSQKPDKRMLPRLLRAPDGSRRTLLLASDLPTYRESLASSLRTSEYDVVEEDLSPHAAKSGAHRVDAAILDISVQSVNALNLCQPIRKATGAPVMVLSSNTSREAVLTAIRAGAKDYVVKPFKHDFLLERIHRVLS